MKICVLALLIQRVAEMRCNKPWSRIRRALRRLRPTEFATESYRFRQRNEIARETSALLKALEIKPPKPVLDVKKTAARE